MSRTEIALVFAGKVGHPDLARARHAVERLVELVDAGATDEAIRHVELMPGPLARNVAAIVTLGLIGLRGKVSDLEDELDDATAGDRAYDALLEAGFALPDRRPPG